MAKVSNKVASLKKTTLLLASIACSFLLPLTEEPGYAKREMTNPWISPLAFSRALQRPGIRPAAAAVSAASRIPAHKHVPTASRTPSYYQIPTASRTPGYYHVPTARHTPNYNQTIYVSRASQAGEKADGSSWQKAFTGLDFQKDHFDWNRVKAGSTIILDGGWQGMPYNGFSIYAPQAGQMQGAAGTPDCPITITTSNEPGHDGQVIIDGHNATKNAVDLGNSQFLRIIGRPMPAGRGVIQPSGPMFPLQTEKSIRVIGAGSNSWGISMSSSANGIVLQDIEIDANGEAKAPQTSGGLKIDGQNWVMRNLKIHNNASNVLINLQAARPLPPQYGLDSGFESCWVYNDTADQMDHYGQHSVCYRNDGISIKSSNQWPANVKLNNSIIGPGLDKGITLYNTTCVVSASNCLFLNARTSNICKDSSADPNRACFQLTNVTSYMSRVNVDGQPHWAIQMREGGLDSCINSMFYGGSIFIDGMRRMTDVSRNIVPPSSNPDGARPNIQYQTAGGMGSMLIGAYQTNDRPLYYMQSLQQADNFCQDPYNLNSVLYGADLTPESNLLNYGPQGAVGARIASVRNLLAKWSAQAASGPVNGYQTAVSYGGYNR